MRRSLTSAALACSIAAGSLAAGLAADDPKFDHPGPPRSASARPPAPSPQAEERATTLVRQHVPELAQVLDRLKETNPPEYRKAIAELAVEAQTLADLRVRNPARADLALDAWKARTRVEYIAAQLASSPSAERESELRAAIEARVDVEVRRHRFEVEQNEATVVKAREQLARTEANLVRNREALARTQKNRNTKVEKQYQSLLPKKPSAPSVNRSKAQLPVDPPSAPASAPSSTQGKAR